MPSKTSSIGPCGDAGKCSPFDDCPEAPLPVIAHPFRRRVYLQAPSHAVGDRLPLPKRPVFQPLSTETRNSPAAPYFSRAAPGIPACSRRDAVDRRIPATQPSRRDARRAPHSLNGRGRWFPFAPRPREPDHVGPVATSDPGPFEALPHHRPRRSRIWAIRRARRRCLLRAAGGRASRTTRAPRHRPIQLRRARLGWTGQLCVCRPASRRDSSMGAGQHDVPAQLSAALVLEAVHSASPPPVSALESWLRIRIPSRSEGQRRARSNRRRHPPGARQARDDGGHARDMLAILYSLKGEIIQV